MIVDTLKCKCTLREVYTEINILQYFKLQVQRILNYKTKHYKKTFTQIHDKFIYSLPKSIPNLFTEDSPNFNPSPDAPICAVWQGKYMHI